MTARKKSNDPSTRLAESSTASALSPRPELPSYPQILRTRLLFRERHARIVPNQGVPFPPGFDYAFVTVEIENMLVRFCRGRGELDVHVGSKHHPRDLHELGLVLSLLDENGGFQRSGISSLYRAAQALESNMDILKGALGACIDEELARRLREVAVNDRTAIREAEWEINKHLRSRRER